MYNNGFQIVQHPDHLVVLYERLHEHRVIPLDGRPHLPPAVSQWMGDSRGRWEGDTLVVAVANFGSQTTYKRSNHQLRLTERYTRTAEDTVVVEITLEDPTTWTRPWTARVTGKRDSGYWADLRVRLSRSELQPEQHAQRRAGTGRSRQPLNFDPLGGRVWYVSVKKA